MLEIRPSGSIAIPSFATRTGSPTDAEVAALIAALNAAIAAEISARISDVNTEEARAIEQEARVRRLGLPLMTTGGTDTHYIGFIDNEVTLDALRNGQMFYVQFHDSCGDDPIIDLGEFGTVLIRDDIGSQVFENDVRGGRSYTARYAASVNQLRVDIAIEKALRTLISARQLTSEKGEIDGYASLDGTGKVPMEQLPTDAPFISNWNANTNSPTIPAASTVAAGRFYEVSIAGSTTIDGISSWAVGDRLKSNGTTWFKIPAPVAVDANTIFPTKAAIQAYNPVSPPQGVWLNGRFLRRVASGGQVDDAAGNHYADDFYPTIDLWSGLYGTGTDKTGATNYLAMLTAALLASSSLKIPVSGGGRHNKIGVSGWCEPGNDWGLQDITVVQLSYAAIYPGGARTFYISGKTGFSMKNVEVDRGTEVDAGQIGNFANIYITGCSDFDLDTVSATGDGSGVGIWIFFSDHFKARRLRAHNSTWHLEDLVWPYVFSSTTTNSDPGAHNVRLSVPFSDLAVASGPTFLGYWNALTDVIVGGGTLSPGGPLPAASSVSVGHFVEVSTASLTRAVNDRLRSNGTTWDHILASAMRLDLVDSADADHAAKISHLIPQTSYKIRIALTSDPLANYVLGTFTSIGSESGYRNFGINVTEVFGTIANAAAVTVSFEVNVPAMHEMIGGIGFVGSTHFTAEDVTSEFLLGSVGADPIRAYQADGLTIGNCQDFTIDGLHFEQVWEGLDVTGSDSNERFKILNGDAVDCFASGFKFANNIRDGEVSNLTALRCGAVGIGIGTQGGTFVDNLVFNNCQVLDAGATNVAGDYWSASFRSGWAIGNGASEAIATTRIRLNNCSAHDRQVVPTMRHAMEIERVPTELCRPQLTGWAASGWTVSEFKADTSLFKPLIEGHLPPVTASLDVPGIANNATATRGSVIYQSAAFGDRVEVALDADLGGCDLWGEVQSAGVVRARIRNETGATFPASGDLEGTLKFVVYKQ